MGEMCAYEYSGGTDADLNQPENTPNKGPGQSTMEERIQV